MWREMDVFGISFTFPLYLCIVSRYKVIRRLNYHKKNPSNLRRNVYRRTRRRPRSIYLFGGIWANTVRIATKEMSAVYEARSSISPVRGYITVPKNRRPVYNLKKRERFPRSRRNKCVGPIRRDDGRLRFKCTTIRSI